MPTQEERLGQVEYSLNQFKTESLRAYRDMAFELTMVKGLCEDSVRRMFTMNQRLDSVDQRLDGMDKRFDGVDKRLDGMDQEIRQRFDAQDKRFDSMDKRLESLDGKFDQVLRVLSTLASGLQKET